jgi:hypothetical protein
MFIHSGKDSKMASVIPTTQEGLLAFYLERQGTWEAKALELGLLPASVTALKSATEALQAARMTRAELKNQAKAATVSVEEKYAELRSVGAGLVATIRAFAETTNNTQVLVTAQLPPQKPPQPAPPPENPTKFTADPKADGTITLKWTGSVAQNGSFDIERSIDGGAFVLLTNKRTKTWTDVAVPMNTNVIVYRIYGVRDDTRSSPGTTAQVLFGNLPAELRAAFRAPGTDSQAA